MRPKPRVASSNEVTITRDGKYALIEFADGETPGTNLGIGSQIDYMTDADILELYNECVRSQLELAAKWRPVEILEGNPQVKFDRRYGAWTTQGHVLRCTVGADHENREVAIEIDGRTLSLSEFGKMIQSYEGWGMRIVFCGEDQLSDPPQPELRKGPKRISKKVLDELVRREAESEFR